jgi:hypothetical protein
VREKQGSMGRGIGKRARRIKILMGCGVEGRRVRVEVMIAPQQIIPNGAKHMCATVSLRLKGCPLQHSPHDPQG